jgi:hypothetical protein
VASKKGKRVKVVRSGQIMACTRCNDDVTAGIIFFGLFKFFMENWTHLTQCDDVIGKRKIAKSTIPIINTSLIGFNAIQIKHDHSAIIKRQKTAK